MKIDFNTLSKISSQLQKVCHWKDHYQLLDSKTAVKTWLSPTALLQGFLIQYANKIHFKMKTLNTITKLVEQDCLITSINLKDAYYSIPIATLDRKYLKFSWKEIYQFMCYQLLIFLWGKLIVSKEGFSSVHIWDSLVSQAWKMIAETQINQASTWLLSRENVRKIWVF